jgi:predicted SAM-dependent methyltransferase
MTLPEGDSADAAGGLLDATKRGGRSGVRAIVEARWFVGRRARALRRRLLRRRRIDDYLAGHAVRKLQIGAGPNPFPGWLNTDARPDAYSEHRNDVIFLDATRPFPFGDATFDYVFSEHQIEHIPEPAARSMVRECFRILRPGGRIRIATPDLAAIIGLYSDPLAARQRHYVDWVVTRFRPSVGSGSPRSYVVNHIFTDHGHEFIYDYETLGGLLREAGFVDVRRMEVGESEDSELRGVERHGRAIGDEEVNRFETLVVEGTRPPAHAAE